MINVMGKFYFAIIIFCLAMMMVGCGTRNSGEDITPISAEAQAVPQKASPTPTLRKEIAKPVSPVSPVSPLKESSMTSATPIKGSEEIVDLVKADLSKQTDIPVEDIKLVDMEAVEWSDSSLGCPQEGYMYSQVITPGYRIVLEADGTEYEYHTDQDNFFVLCEEPVE